MKNFFRSLNLSKKKLTFLSIPIICGLVISITGGIPLGWVTLNATELPVWFNEFKNKYFADLGMFGMFAMLPLMPFFLVLLPLNILFGVLGWDVPIHFFLISMLLVITTKKRVYITKGDIIGLCGALLILTLFYIPIDWMLQVQSNRAAGGLTKPDGQSGMGEMFVMTGGTLLAGLFILLLRMREKAH